MTKKKIKNGKTIITHILLMIFALIQIYPLFWLFEFSLKDNSEIFGGNIAGLPQHWRFGNYVTAFRPTLCSISSTVFWSQLLQLY